MNLTWEGIDLYCYQAFSCFMDKVFMPDGAANRLTATFKVYVKQRRQWRFHEFGFGIAPPKSYGLRFETVS